MRQDIRAHVAEIRRRIFPQAENFETLLDGDAILTRLEILTGVRREGVRHNHQSLQKSHAIIIPDHFTLLFNEELTPWFARFCQAHEYGHLFLHGDTAAHCADEDIAAGLSESDSPTGERRLTGYSRHERREREANLFARELLLPSDLLKKLFVENGWRATDFARQTGLQFDFVCQQLAFALLISDSVTIKNETVADSTATLELDASQRRAAHSDKQCLLIEAGPGTGKTRTLIGRVLYLLETGVAPDNILALTYSNKAAEEMRRRIAQFAPEAAAQVWLGTFHAFGLEALRKFTLEADLSANFQLLDSIDAQILLEKNLLELKLEHYRSLHNPTEHLKSILGAVSRAKDELISPREYAEAAAAMLANAVTDEQATAAEKCAEVARVYAFYNELLQRNNWLDFGDLIARTVDLLRRNEAVKNYYQTEFTHFLVDEFQDVNRASSCLLQELTSANGNLWVVGDARQTIYRWRGASDKNLRHFAQDFPEAENLSLEINYRSNQSIVNLLNEIATHVAHSENFAGWKTAADSEQSNAAIRYVETTDFHHEAAFLADEIKRQIAAGRNFKDVAILGRTNNILAKIADELTARDVPILYLGNVFERAEIRDLLCLLTLTSENRGRHLLRLAKIGEYALNVGEIRRLIADADARGQMFPSALSLANTDFALSDEFKLKIEVLQNHLADVTDDVSAWDFWKTYLFDRSDYLLEILRDDSVQARQKRFAIYQLLQLAIDETAKNKSLRIAAENPRQSFLRLVRFLAASGEEAAFRRLPAWAENIDAARLLTVHAAKGLEFPVVLLPYLGNGYFPNKNKSENCPLPTPFKNDDSDKKAAHTAEELCLFFVALSRAEENLILTRAQKYGNVSKHSTFFDLIPNSLPEKTSFELVESPLPLLTRGLLLPDAPRRFSFYELQTFIHCGRRYFYDYVLRLRGTDDAAFYLQFHAAVRETIRWAQAEKSANRDLTAARAVHELRQVWTRQPLSRHAYSQIYLTEAETLVAKAVEMLAGIEPDRTGKSNVSLEFEIEGHQIFVAPDLVIDDAAQISLRKIKTGRAKQAEKDLTDDEKLFLAALHEAARQTFAHAETSAAFVYLTGEQFVYSGKNAQTQLEKLAQAADKIRRRDFAPNPDIRKCHACAHYFICPGGDL